MNITAAQQLDNELTIKIHRGLISPMDARVARAIVEVTGLKLDNGVLAAAQGLVTMGLSSHQIRRNYRAAGLTHDLVHEALAAASVEVSA